MVPDLKITGSELANNRSSNNTHEHAFMTNKPLGKCLVCKRTGYEFQDYCYNPKSKSYTKSKKLSYKMVQQLKSLKTHK